MTTPQLQDSTSHFLFPRLLNDPLHWKSSMYFAISTLNPSSLALYPRKLTCKGGLNRFHSLWVSSQVQPIGSMAGDGKEAAGYPFTLLPPLVLWLSPSPKGHCLVREPSSHSSLSRVLHLPPPCPFSLRGDNSLVVPSSGFHPYTLSITCK